MHLHYPFAFAIMNNALCIIVHGQNAAKKMQKCKSHFGQTTRHARRFGSEPRWFAVFCRVIRNLYYDSDSVKVSNLSCK